MIFLKGYKEGGYFPEAVINFLVLLGWNPGTEQEVFNIEELITDIRPTAAFIKRAPDSILTKHKWFNHHYMQDQHNDNC